MIPVIKSIIPDEKQFQGYIHDILQTGQFSNNGPHLQRLELILQVFLGVPNFLAFNNGTIALMLALKALNVRGAVITTPFTFPATANVLPWVGCYPIFADIEYESMNITPETVRRQINGKTAGLLPVHVFGYPCDVNGFKKLSENYRLKLIYDAAHAFNVTVDGKGIGNFGDCTMFSFHPTKLFHTGEGGGLAFTDPDLKIKLQQLRNFGIQDDETGSIRPGINGKMSEMQAALGLCVFDKILHEIESRKNIFSYYKNKLNGIKILNLPENISGSYQYFPIRVKYRNKIFETLKKNNIQARKYFYPLCSNFPHFGSVRKPVIPVARQVAEEILCLPFYAGLDYGTIDKITDIIQEIE